VWGVGGCRAQVLGPTKSSFIACIRLKNAKFMGLVSDLKLSSASGILDNIVYSEQKRIFPVAFLTDKKIIS
jgi:hypothetical protein